jgi:hypothetical protein
VRVRVKTGRLALDLVEFLRGMGYLARIEDETEVEAVLPLAPPAAAQHDLAALLRLWERHCDTSAVCSWTPGSEGAAA